MHSFRAAPSLEKPLQQYIQTLQRKALSKGSLTNYRSDLALFLQFIADYRLQHWQNLTAKQAQAFFREGLHRDKSHASNKRQLSSVRGFLRYLQQHQLLSIDPLIGFELHPEDAVEQKSSLKPPTKTQCDQLLSFDADSFISVRDKAMIRLLVNTPISLEALITLDVFCVNFEQKSIALNRPSKETTHYKITDPCLSDLNAWLAYRQQKMTFDQSLFVSERGKALTTRAVQLRVKFWREKTGVARYTLLQLKSALQGLDKPVSIDRQALLTTFMKAHPRAIQDD